MALWGQLQWELVPSQRSPWLSHRTNDKLCKGTLQEYLMIISAKVQSQLCYKIRRNPQDFPKIFKSKDFRLSDPLLIYVNLWPKKRGIRQQLPWESSSLYTLLVWLLTLILIPLHQDPEVSFSPKMLTFAQTIFKEVQDYVFLRGEKWLSYCCSCYGKERKWDYTWWKWIIHKLHKPGEHIMILGVDISH